MDKRFINENKDIRQYKMFFRRLDNSLCRLSFNRAKACAEFKWAFMYMPKTKTD